MEKFFYQEAPEKYWDFEALKNPPAFQDDFDEASACDGLRAITFDGVTENGKRTRTFAYIALPDGEMPVGGWPGIVLVHGGGGTAFAWAAKLWASYGFAVLAPDWYGRRPVNADIANGSGELARPYIAHTRTHSPEDTPAHITNVANLVLAHSLLRSLPEVNPENTAYGAAGTVQCSLQLIPASKESLKFIWEIKRIMNFLSTADFSTPPKTKCIMWWEPMILTVFPPPCKPVLKRAAKCSATVP